jgi:hypothetical protein
MENIKLIYKNHEENILINYFNNNIINNSKKSKGNFILENDKLIITWIKYDFILNSSQKNTEIFLKNNKLSTNDLLIFDFLEENNKEEEKKEIDQEDVNINDKIEKEYFVHPNWEDFINLDLNNFLFKRSSSTENDGFFIIDQNKDIILNWYNFEKEIFSKNLYDNNYYLIENYDNSIEESIINQNELPPIINEIELSIINDSWEDVCIINNKNNYIYRKSNTNEFGNFKFQDEKLIIFWEKWNPEIFYKSNDKYYIDKNIYIILQDDNDDLNEYIILDNYFIKKNNPKEKIFFLYNNISDNYYIIKDNILQKYIYYKNYDLKKIYKTFNYENNILFIINIDIFIDLKKLFEEALLNISKKTKIILNIYKTDYFENNFIDKLINYYDNLIIIRYSKNNILKFLNYINDEIINYKDLEYENIIYIDKYFENIDSLMIENFINKKLNYNSFLSFNNKYSEYYNIFFNKINNLLRFSEKINYYDLCIIVIIFYIYNLKIFTMLENNFMINKYIFNQLLDYDLTKKYYI